MISVIIPTFNTALLIERTLRSVLGQEGGYELEVLVVDDCSTDNTLAVVESIGDFRIRIFHQQCNQGPAAARNRGLREAKGEYFAFLDGDDYWEPEFLKETVGFLEDHPDCVAVSVGQCHKILGKQPSYVPRQQEYTSPVQLRDFFDFWAKYNHVCTGSVLMRTAVARETGGQREDLRVCEDLEFWALLATYGPWGFIPKTLFTSDGGEVTKKQGWLEKNLIRWQSAPPMQEWLQRINAREKLINSSAMAKAFGRIARILCYCHILSNRDSLARAEIRSYGKFFPHSKINSILCLFAKCPLLWQPLCWVIRLRELCRL